MNTLYVNYATKGRPLADWETVDVIETLASLCINGQDKRLNVSTENAINAARCLKLEGKITCSLIIMFEGEELPMNEYCKIDSWPKGFCDYNEEWIGRCLRARMEMYKQNKR